ncbi:MAG: glycosyltransferase family 4 protein [Chthoniobacterales bacterium]
MTQLTIGFVRRGYSQSGGAESYLKRLARGVVDKGHRVVLFTSTTWPEPEWPGDLVLVGPDAPLRFAEELERAKPQCDVLMSLERVWHCDVYRAGDGVHRAWLERRAPFERPLRRFGQAINPKHLAILRLEQSLFGRRSARRVIANSHLVKSEITRIYDYPASQIDIIHNGVPVEMFANAEAQRADARQQLGLSDEALAILFVGSGWERKGLRFAIEAVQASELSNARLGVAGRGDQRRFASPAVHFLGERDDVAALYAAADVFLLPTIYDPFSNACLEALASGLPVITTRANGFAEIMRDRVDGTIVERPNDRAALIEALRFWSDTEQRRQTRENRLELARRYDISINVNQTLDVLVQLASAESTSG